MSHKDNFTVGSKNGTYITMGTDIYKSPGGSLGGQDCPGPWEIGI